MTMGRPPRAMTVGEESVRGMDGGFDGKGVEEEGRGNGSRKWGKGRRYLAGRR